MEAFISYSHKDEKYLERLKVHLSQMKRDGLINDWTDHAIRAGATLDNEISSALASSNLFIALVSPDYIASNYCYKREFETALKRQAEGRLTIVPIIVEPCDWHSTPFSKFKAVPKDGKAISEWTNPNIAFLNIIEELRLLSQADNLSNTTGIPSAQAHLTPRNYRVKHYFSQVDKVNFKEESFNQIKSYFKSSIKELDAVENLQARFTREDIEYFTCLISNRANGQNCYITVQIGNEDQRMSGDLSYNFEANRSTNTFQMGNVFNIKDDEYEQFWQKNNIYGYGSTNDQIWNANQVAEQIWSDFISKVGVSLN